MKIAVISNNRYLDNEAETINLLFEAGLDYFHIKKNTRNSKKLTRLLDKINPAYYNRINIHKNYSKAVKYKLQGVHFTNKHREKYIKTCLLKLLLRLRHKNIKFTMSYHSLESLTEDTSDYEYSFLSPIFGSITKKYQPGFKHTTLRVILKRLNKQVFALGGVSIHNIKKAHELGFSGVVLSTYLWNSKEPIQDFKKAKELVDSLV